MHVRLCHWLSVPVLSVLLIGGGSGLIQAAEKEDPKDTLAFGSLRAPSPEQARSQAEGWLKGVGKADEATQKEFQKIWDNEDAALLDKVADTLCLGDANVGKILAEARNMEAAAPKEVPSLIKDTKVDPYLRANLALAYAKALSNRKVYEESLEALKTVKPELVVDPASYFFHKAVAEHSQLLKDDASRSIVRLLDDVSDAPERYKMVAALMYFDMQNWKEKDLDWIARKMKNIERRLELARGGAKTQKEQKEVVARLDEIIKELENQKKGGGS
jgi:hypothetical protein